MYIVGDWFLSPVAHFRHLGSTSNSRANWIKPVKAGSQQCNPQKSFEEDIQLSM